MLGQCKRSDRARAINLTRNVNFDFRTPRLDVNFRLPLIKRSSDIAQTFTCLSRKSTGFGCESHVNFITRSISVALFYKELPITPFTDVFNERRGLWFLSQWNIKINTRVYPLDISFLYLKYLWRCCVFTRVLKLTQISA